jgi:hypothetical protein
MESIETVREHIDELLNEDCLYSRRVTRFFGREYNLDKLSDVNRLLEKINNFENSLRNMKTSLLKEYSKKRTLVACVDCYYNHQIDDFKDRYFCFNAREYIDRKIDEKIACKAFEPI